MSQAIKALSTDTPNTTGIEKLTGCSLSHARVAGLGPHLRFLGAAAPGSALVWRVLSCESPRTLSRTWSSGPREVLGWDLHCGDVLLQGPVGERGQSPCGHTNGCRTRAGWQQCPSAFPNALGTPCWGNILTGDPTADRTNHPSRSQAPNCSGVEEASEGRGPSVVGFGSGKAQASGICSPVCPDPWPVQPSEPLPWSWHSLPGGRGRDTSDGLVPLMLTPSDSQPWL